MIVVQPLVAPVKPQGTRTIQERFEAFHRLNPWVLAAMETLTTEYVERGHKRVGIGMLAEVIRWEYGRTVGDHFRLNNSYRSRYVRLLVATHPEWANLFETRALRAA